jgi:hypothetical protein
VEELQGALPTFEQLKDMTYLQYVLKEGTFHLLSPDDGQ